MSTEDKSSELMDAQNASSSDTTNPGAGSGTAPDSEPGQDPKNVQELTNYIQNMLQQMQDRFQTMSDQIIGRIDDMAARIDDLEHNINDLMVQAGQSDGPQQQAIAQQQDNK